jgi:hypothetical protein
MLVQDESRWWISSVQFSTPLVSELELPISEHQRPILPAFEQQCFVLSWLVTIVALGPPLILPGSASNLESGAFALALRHSPLDLQFPQEMRLPCLIAEACAIIMIPPRWNMTSHWAVIRAHVAVHFGLLLMLASDDASGGRRQTASEEARVETGCSHRCRASGSSSRWESVGRMRMVTFSKAGCKAFSSIKERNLEQRI